MIENEQYFKFYHLKSNHLSQIKIFENKCSDLEGKLTKVLEYD